MFPFSACAVGEGRGLKKNQWPACWLIALVVLLGALYYTCSSGSSDIGWLSLRPLGASSSLIDPELSPSTKLNSLPDKGTQENSTDYERGAEEVDHYSNATPEIFTVEKDLKELHNEEKVIENLSHWQEFPPTPSVQHAELHKEHKSPEAHILDKGLLTAIRAISAAAANVHTDLYAPVYHNLTRFTKSYELMERMFKIYIYKDGTRPLVHMGPIVGVYGSEGRFIHQLESSKRYVTSDHSKAHLFFMPYSVTNMVRKLYVPDSHSMDPITSFITSYVNTISTKYPYWNQSHGADHFFVSCHDWGPASARKHVELQHNAIKVVCNADTNEEFVVEKDVSLPETYLRAAKPPRRLGGLSVKKRPFLAFFAGQMHGHVRPLLLQHWKNKDPDMRIYERIPSAIAKKTSYIRHMRMSKYCICPMGYEVNSPRIVEAIYYDCVPVIIADNFVLPFSEVLDWQAFAVTVEERQIPQLRHILLSIPQTKYTTMQANLKHVRQHFSWQFRTPVKYDVFHMILHSLWLRRLAAVPDSLL